MWLGNAASRNQGPDRRLRNVEDDGLIDRLHPSEASRMRVIKKAAGQPKCGFELFKQLAGRQFFRAGTCHRMPADNDLTPARVG